MEQSPAFIGLRLTPHNLGVASFIIWLTFSGVLTYKPLPERVNVQRSLQEDFSHDSS
jgi:hypothetical protein